MSPEQKNALRDLDHLSALLPLPCVAEHTPESRAYGNRSPLSGLGLFSVKVDESAFQIHLVPCQIQGGFGVDVNHDKPGYFSGDYRHVPAGRVEQLFDFICRHTVCV